MYKQIAMGLGAKKLVNAVGKAASSAYGIVSKTGKALGAAGKAAGDIANSDSKQDTKSSNVIAGNFGMAGSAGRQRVAGGGTLPGPKAVAKPQVTTKMPTEALLNITVKYLTSIDKTLKSQIEFDRRSYQEQAQIEREAIIENKPSATFSNIKDRLSGLKSDVKDNVSTAATIAKFALILGGAAALIVSSLDEKQLDALKENVNQFKKSFGWLGELGAAVGAGGLFGFLFGGKGVTGRLKGGLVGMVAAHIGSRLYSSFSGGNKTDEDGNVILDQNGDPIKESRSMSGIGYGLSAIAGGIAIKNITKKLPAAKLAAQTAGQYGRAAASSSVAGMQAATRKGTSWLASRRGRKFLIILARKLGKGAFAKVFKYLARIVFGLLAAVTGIGAIPGILIILANVIFIGWDIFDIATSIWDAFTESATEDTTSVAVPAVKETDATKLTGSIAGAPQGPGNLPPIPADIGKILAALRTNESGGNYGENSTKNGSSASGAYQFLDGTWKEQAAIAGIGTEYSRAYMAPPEVQDAVAASHVKNILKRPDVNGDVSKVPLVWFTGSADGAISAKAQSVNAATPQQVQAKFMKTYDGGKFASSSYNSTESASSGIGGMVNAGAGKLGEIFGMLGSSVVKPGVRRVDTPSTPNASEQINNESTKLQNDITFGIKKEKSKGNITMPTISAGKPRNPSPVKSVSSMDPNYGNIDVLSTYLAHFKLAA